MLAAELAKHGPDAALMYAPMDRLLEIRKGNTAAAAAAVNYPGMSFGPINLDGSRNF